MAAVIGGKVPLTEEEKTSLVINMNNRFCGKSITFFSNIYMIDNIQEILFMLMHLTVCPYNIRTIYLSELDFTIEFIEKMAFYLINNKLPKIRYISMDNNNGGVFLAVFIAYVFQLNPYVLQELDIICNHITDDGAIKIAKSLKYNTTLLSLNLKGNNIGDAGAIALAEFLVSNTTLEHLDLSENQISDIGFEEICKALKVNKTLLNLNINKNRILNWGLLISALEENFVINKLIIDVVMCETKTLTQCWKLLDRNINLYKNQYWLPWRHMSFTSVSIYRTLSDSIFTRFYNIYYSCHNIIISSIICGNEFSVRLPMGVWKYIFSFFRLNKFIKIS